MNGNESALDDLVSAYRDSPEPSFKVSTYFPIYADLFSHLRGKACTFVETGVLHGGSLFMWRQWLGDKARIIGLDLNPAAQRWREHGFEIHIGDQGDPAFWRRTLAAIGSFDVLLDDGGHQSLQQMVTASEALRAAKGDCLVVIEDTCCSLMREFSRHGDRTFLDYAKASTDVLVARLNGLFPDQMPPVDPSDAVEVFSKVYSTHFYAGVVAFRVSGAAKEVPRLVWNRQPARDVTDFRYDGVASAELAWPNPFAKETVVVNGGRA